MALVLSALFGNVNGSKEDRVHRTHSRKGFGRIESDLDPLNFAVYLDESDRIHCYRVGGPGSDRTCLVSTLLINQAMNKFK
jgi:hypothetical protein